MRTLVARSLLACGLVAAASSAGAQGRQAWRRQVGPTAGSVALAVEDGVVVTVTWVGEVVALDAETGRVRWRIPAPRDQERRLAHDTWMGLAGGVAVVARAQSSWIEAYEARSGQPRWRHEIGASPTSFASCDGFRLVAVTHRGTGVHAGTLVATAIDPATGDELWMVPVAGDIRSAADGYLFVSDPSSVGRLPGSLTAIRCEDGLRRSVPTGNLSYPEVIGVDSGRALIGETNGPAAMVVPLEGGSPLRLAVGQVPVRPAALHGQRLYYSASAGRELSLFAFNLDTGRPLARSQPNSSSSDLLFAGAQIVTGFGGTRTPDRVVVLDPDDLSTLAVVPVPSAPGPFVADEHRAYTATYDGSVVAITLPRPAPARAQLRVLQARAPPAPPRPPPAGFEIVSERVLDAHPVRARTSGALTQGTVSALAFVADGSLVATGGNDDRVRTFRVSDGAELWASPPLGKNVEFVASAGRRIAARTYHGRVHVWDVDEGGRGRQIMRASPRAGWSFGLVPSGTRVAADDMDGAVRVLDVPGGSELATISGLTGDARAMTPHGRWLVRPMTADTLGVIDLDAPVAPAIAASIPLPAPPERATLVQAWARSAREIVLEWCTPRWCETQLVRPDGSTAARVRFDTTGAQWAVTVPSTLEVSSDGEWLFFHRNGLEPVVVRLDTGERVIVTRDEATRWSGPSAVFSPVDSTRFALTSSPAAYQVTLFRIRRR